MATRVIDDTKLQNIAVAIQGKDSGGVMTVDEMPARIAAIPARDDTVLDSLISRNITSIESDVTSVGTGAFKWCSNLTSAILSEATALGVSAFDGCTHLTNIEVPKVTTVYASSFYDNLYLTRIFLQSATALNGSQIFRDCSRLTAVIMGKRATLANANTFTGANNAIIYVQPDDLSWYSTETNWSTLYADNRIKSVSELTGDDLTWYQQLLAKYPED